MIVLKRLMLFFIVWLVVREASFRTFAVSDVIVYSLPCIDFFNKTFVCRIKKIET